MEIKWLNILRINVSHSTHTRLFQWCFELRRYVQQWLSDSQKSTKKKNHKESANSRLNLGAVLPETLKENQSEYITTLSKTSVYINNQNYITPFIIMALLYVSETVFTSFDPYDYLSLCCATKRLNWQNCLQKMLNAVELGHKYGSGLDLCEKHYFSSDFHVRILIRKRLKAELKFKKKIRLD